MDAQKEFNFFEKKSARNKTKLLLLRINVFGRTPSSTSSTPLFSLKLMKALTALSLSVGAFLAASNVYFERKIDNDMRYSRAVIHRHILEKINIGLKEGLTAPDVLQLDRQAFDQGY